MRSDTTNTTKVYCGHRIQLKPTKTSTDAKIVELSFMFIDAYENANIMFKPFLLMKSYMFFIVGK